MSESNFTLRVDEQLKEDFIAAAKSSDRTGAQLIRDYMRDYVRSAKEKEEYDAWFRAKVEAGREDFRQGRFYTQEQMAERFKQFREELIAKHGNAS